MNKQSKSGAFTVGVYHDSIHGIIHVVGFAVADDGTETIHFRKLARQERTENGWLEGSMKITEATPDHLRPYDLDSQYFVDASGEKLVMFNFDPFNVRVRVNTEGKGDRYAARTAYMNADGDYTDVRGFLTIGNGIQWSWLRKGRFERNIKPATADTFGSLEEAYFYGLAELQRGYRLAAMSYHDEVKIQIVYRCLCMVAL